MRVHLLSRQFRGRFTALTESLEWARPYLRRASENEPIVSPTFTILKEYDEGRLPLYHFDVYRIGSSDEMEEIGYFDKISSGDGVCLIEWSVLIEDVIPEDAIRIEIKKDRDKGFDYRTIVIDQD